jgi:hypothetical protein
VGITAILASGPAAALYVLLYLCAASPGLPLGWALFGRTHGAGWISGLLIGYGATQLALWLPIGTGSSSRVMFLLAWGTVSLLLAFVGLVMRGPLLAMAVWTRADTRALTLVILLAPLLMVLPYRHIGAADREGTRYYRAYFTADFFWHTALAAELGKYSMPPRNPYLAPWAMHYYWAYFLLPAVVAHDGPAPLQDVQSSLKTNAICSAALVFAAMWLLVRLAVPRPWAAALAVTLGVVAASAEGTFVIQQLARAGRPLAAVTDLNIDAITAWQFGGLRIDCLPRAIFYNPQHSMSCALALIAMLVAARGPIASTGAAMVAGIALGLSTCFNPFIGGVFSLIYGASVAWQALGSGAIRVLFHHAAAVVPVLLALAWCSTNGVFSGAGGAVTLGVTGFARHYPLVTLLLSTGPVLVPALAGAWPWRHLDPGPARVAVVGVILSIILLYGVSLSEASWVGFRAGQILLLFLPVLLARTFIRLAEIAGRTGVAALTLAILAAGLPTTAIDVYNAQDISNVGRGPDFPWTLTVTAEQQDAFRWIRRMTQPDAIVQMEPIVRGRAHWSLIPSFGQRRMAAGLPISLLPVPEYAKRSEDVRLMFAGESAQSAVEIAHRLRIDYVYVDDTDRAAYPRGVEKFAAHPEAFTPVYRSARVSVYRVN